jgi:uncharacterized zinc-type alcohol dehydrogenase-like protein
MTIQAYGYATQLPQNPLKPFHFERRDPRPEDVVIDILYCGICHSDIHAARNEWGRTTYPFVPGHEIVGRISAKGINVSKFEVGDLVGVGCMVDSCRVCDSCHSGVEQYCSSGFTGTWGSTDKIGGTPHSYTFGGYSNKITVDEQYVLRIPKNLNLAATAPLLCAGITMYSPLNHWGMGPGKKIGIIGLGGLGHIGVKLASAMGAHVVAITTTLEKAVEARKLGAQEVLVSKNAGSIQKEREQFDFLINTIPVGHDMDPYIDLLKNDGTMVVVGAVEPLTRVNGALLIFRRRTIAGSLIGGIAETQKMLDFCGEHHITCDIETIAMEEVNRAFDRTVKGDVRYRFVINMSTLKSI